MDGHLRPRRKWWQFGVGTLLFMTFCSAGGLGGYRAGLSIGRREGFANAREEDRLRTIDIKAISVQSLLDEPGIDSEKRAQRIITLITTTIAPESWVDVGGPHSAHYFASKQCIDIVATGAVHDQVTDLLEQLRRLDKKTRDGILKNKVAVGVR